MTWFEDKYGALKVGARVRLLSDESEWLLTPSGWEPVNAIRPRRRCMWPRCPKTNFWDPDIDMCKAHSLVIAQRTVAIDDERAAKEQSQQQARLDQYATESAANAEREDAGLPAVPQTAPSYVCVYYLKVGDLIKIGMTRNLARRLAVYPPGSELLGLEYGGAKVERERHQQFHALLSHGREWFLDRPEIRAHIEALPVHDDLAYAQRRHMKLGPSRKATGGVRLSPTGRAVS